MADMETLVADVAEVMRQLTRVEEAANTLTVSYGTSRNNALRTFRKRTFLLRQKLFKLQVQINKEN